MAVFQTTEKVVCEMSKKVSILSEVCKNPFEDKNTNRKIVLHNAAEFDSAVKNKRTIYKEEITLKNGCKRTIYYIIVPFEEIVKSAF